MDTSYQKARSYFESGWYCAESVLKTIAEEEAVDSTLIPRIATGFCGGMARSSEMCGAVTGGIMALGLVFGRRTREDQNTVVYAAVQELLHRFAEANQTTNCSELLGCDLGTEEGRATFKENKLSRQCADYSGQVAAMVREIIDGRKPAR